MRELIPRDEYGMFVDKHDTARVDSLFVAEFLKKIIIRFYVISGNLTVPMNSDCPTLDSPII